MPSKNGQYLRHEALRALDTNTPVPCYACERKSPARCMDWQAWKAAKTWFRPLHPQCAQRYRGSCYTTHTVWRHASERDDAFTPHWER